MNRDRYNQLLAERSTVQQIIDKIPQENVIELNSFFGRLDELDSLINEVGAPLPTPARTRLTYKGRPVIDSYGISADFGMSATKAYTNAVNRVAASIDRYIPLAATGPIPNQTQNQVIITGTALGSFGFEIEEYMPEQLSIGESSVATALLKTQELLQGTLGTDDELTDVMTGIDPRAISALRSFLKILSVSEAICTAETNGKVFQFNDVSEIRRGYERLSLDNLHEEPKSFVGVFQGMLPQKRTFEFKVAESEEVIFGKLGPEAATPDITNRINQNLYKSVKIQTTAISVGSGQPRYILIENPEWAN